MEQELFYHSQAWQYRVWNQWHHIHTKILTKIFLSLILARDVINYHKSKK